jgi:membrane protease YdiL (CAAX protease family)
MDAAMPGTTDLLFACVFAVVWPLWNHFVDWPRHLRAVAAGDPTARTRIYRRTVLEQWMLTVVAVGLTLIHARSFATLGLTVPTGWRLVVGVAVPIAYLLVAMAQLRSFARPEALAKVRDGVAPLKPLLPHTAAEWSWFRPLAVTAGICEELLFRGYLVWVLTPFLGLWGAAGLSVVIFGVAHGYQGVQFAARAFLAGVVMGALALVTGSVLPGMLLHALVDLVGGYAGYLVMRAEPADTGTEAVALASSPE